MISTMKPLEKAQPCIPFKKTSKFSCAENIRHQMRLGSEFSISIDEIGF